MSAPNHYRVLPVDPAGHRFEVTLTIPDPDPAGQRLRLPAWIPGSYMIRDFSKHLVEVVATCDDTPVGLRKMDSHTWLAEACDGPLVVRAVVYAWDPSVRKAHLDQTHGFFNGTSLFLEVVGQGDRACTLQLDPPRDPACQDWRVATTLPRVDGEPWGFGTFRAEDHDALVDHPVEMGTFDLVSFEARGIPHHLAVTGRHSGDLDRVARDLTAVCEAHLDHFGEPYPIDRYLFLLTVTGEGRGGLEHRASTALVAPRDQLPRPGERGISDGYRDLLALCSHEYFHTWNVKRIKPAVFAPYDLSRPGHTEQLWAFEGVTVYFEGVGLRRAGLLDLDGWLKHLGEDATRVQRTAGRHVQTVAQSSFDAWTKLYQADEDAPNQIVSYYTKGALVALALDLTMRRASEEQASLDTLWRALWDRYGDGSGVPEGAIEALASELAGVDLRGFFQQALHDTADLPLAELLEPVGLRMGLRPATGDDDKGGTPPGDTPDAAPAHLGVTVASAPLGARLRHVHRGGPAHAAGLSAGDVIVAMDGLRVRGKDLTKRVRTLAPGTVVRIHAFRDDVLRTVDARLAPAPQDTVWFAVDPDAPPEAVARRQRWLDGVVR